MKYSVAIPSLDGATLQRLMRRQTLDPAVKVIKITLAILSFILLVAAIAQAISGYLNVTSTSAELSQSVDAAKARVQQLTTTPSKKVDLGIIHQRAIFGSIAGPTPAPRTDPNSGKAGPKTPMRLIGTFITLHEPPYAIIEEDKKKVQDVFGIGETVFSEAKLVSIGSDRVELDRNGEREILTLDDTNAKGADFKGGIAALEGDRYLVEEAELDKALENLPMLLTQARAVPYFRDGKATGLRLFAVKGGSLYEKLGLKNGDILKGLNGNSLADLSQAMQLFEKLKTERSINLTLERNSEDKEFKYEIR